MKVVKEKFVVLLCIYTVIFFDFVYMLVMFGFEESTICISNINILDLKQKKQTDLTGRGLID